MSDLNHSPSNSELKIKCTRCKFRGPLSSFPRKKNMKFLKTCHDCTRKQSDGRASTREAKENKENISRKHQGPAQQSGGRLTVKWHDVISLTAEHKEQAFELDVIVELEMLIKEMEETGEELENTHIVRKVADAVWKTTGYRFIYKKSQRSRTSDNIKTYTFFCAQLRGQETKTRLVEDAKKRRARMMMDRFDCNGWLHVTMTDGDITTAILRLSHHHTHCCYVDIDIDENNKKIIENMKNLPPSKIWDEIMKKNGETELTEKQIYSEWMRVNESEWKLDKDQVKSAIMLLERMEGEKAEIIPIQKEEGINAIAFTFKDILDDLCDDIEELAMDSTWKTNAQGYELYALVAEANGQGIPIAFTFTTSDGSAEEGAKDRMLQDVIQFLGKRCPNIRFTLSDKDMSEINAFRTKLPNAKHQLCYWHAIRYLEERLAEKKPPAKYDPRKAHNRFKFIDPTWAPGVTSGQLEDGVHEVDAEVEGNMGVRKHGTAAKQSVQRGKPSDQERIVIKLPGTISVSAGDARGEHTSTTEGSTACRPAPTQEPAAKNSMQERIPETCLPPLLIIKSGDKRIPVWPNPPPIKKGDLPIFCPEEFRTTIIEKFRIHLHQHPKIPLNDERGSHLTMEEIYHGAVHDIYQFCFGNDLSQVWAYLWNRWYNPNQWPLWARSTCDAIPRLKTTMVVESLWKHIKRRDLPHFNRPGLDLVTHVVMRNLLPRVSRTLAYVQGLRRQGRPKALAGWQRDFKHDWVDMSRPDELRIMKKELSWLKAPRKKAGRAERLAEIEEEKTRPHGKYHTDMTTWTCSCPAYLISRFLLCKHLVRLANEKLENRPPTDLRFFLDLRRKHYPPYYSIPGIHEPLASSGDIDEEEIEVLLLGRHEDNGDTSIIRKM